MINTTTTTIAQLSFPETTVPILDNCGVDKQIMLMSLIRFAELN